MVGSVFAIVVNWMQWDNLTIVTVLVIGGIILPSAIISIMRDETARERTRLIKQIPPDLVIQNPQAAIEHAFTHFEDYLRKRLGVGPDLFGKRLIDFAFAKNGKLIFSEIESENEGVRNFVAGAYATFRNPRKHRIVQDDEQTTFVIISMIELLFKIVDESKDQAQSPNQHQ